MPETDNNAEALNALSPLDGRYRAQTRDLANYFSEAALIKHRVIVELEWLKTIRPLLAPDIKASDEDIDALRDSVSAHSVKAEEKKTRHDMKAAEVCIARQLEQNNLGELRPLLHFACTSWDINNIAQTLMLRGAIDKVMLPQLQKIVVALDEKAQQYAALPMLSRTHGQPASPTTVGKEFANFAARLQSRAQKIAATTQNLPAKMNGATGNYNAHYAARPDLDWQKIAREFVEGMDLRFASHTTQIEPYDEHADLFRAVVGANNVMLDLCRDMWGYIALDYFALPTVAGEVGSSTMPHKVNPIDFENAEGNIGLSNALLNHLADKLQVSRWQRDLSDSTAVRSTGAALGYALIAWRATERGLAKLAAREDKIAADLNANWQVLAEAAMTILRAEGNADAYDILKQATRGKTFNETTMREVIESLPLSEDAKTKLRALTPQTYTGIAQTLAKR